MVDRMVVLKLRGKKWRGRIESLMNVKSLRDIKDAAWKRSLSYLYSQKTDWDYGNWGVILWNHISAQSNKKAFL